MIKPNIYIEDFNRLLIDFVKYYKTTDKRSDRPQTFAVLENYTDLDTGNLEKTKRDKDLPYLYSREWVKENYSPSAMNFKHPLLAVFYDNVQLLKPFSKGSKEINTVEIVYLKKYDRDDCIKGNSETRSEIYKDAKDKLKELLVYLNGVRWYNDTGSADHAKGLYHPSTITGLGLTPIESQEDEIYTRFFHKNVIDEKQTISMDHWHGGIRDLYGRVMTLKIGASNCDSFTYVAKHNSLITKDEDLGDRQKI